MKYLVCAILMIPFGLSAYLVDYGFDGDLSSVLVESGLTDNTYPMEQVAGRLIYHNNGSITPDSTTLMELIPFRPTKASVWSLQVDVTIPGRMRNVETGEDPEFFIGIGCYNNKDGSLRFFTTEVNVGSLGDREAKASIGVDDFEPFANESNITILQESIKMKITYFGGQVTLFTTNLGSGSDLLFSADIDPAGLSLDPEHIIDWGLLPEDTLTLFLVVNSNNYPIYPERPLQFDNLYAIVNSSDTVDGGITAQKPDILSMEVKSFPTAVSELQKSHDLENWITIKTLARGIKETMHLPADGGKAYYRVVHYP